MPDKLHVSQAARDFAADEVLRRLTASHGGQSRWMVEAVASIRTGQQDGHPEVQHHAQFESRIREELIGKLRPWLKHDGLCALIGGYDHCTCGFEDAIATLQEPRT